MNYNARRVCKIRRAVAVLFVAATLVEAGNAQSASAAEFAVASIRPNRAGNMKGEGSDNEKTTISPTSLIMWNVTLRSCLRWAYGLHDYQVEGPGWMASDRFDISAKTSEESTVEQMKLAVQKLLGDRFKMTVRYEAKELPIYAMSVKRRDKLKAAAGGERTMRPAGGAMEFRNFSMADLAERLGVRPFKLDRIVLDRTELPGLFDFKVEFSDDINGLKRALEGIELGSPGAPSMLPLLQEQLGLAFKPQKAPIDSLIVDHALRVPSGN